MTEPNKMKVLNIYEPNNSIRGTVFPGVSPEFKADGAEFEKQCEFASEYYQEEHHANVDTIPLLKMKWWKGGKALKKRQDLFRELRFDCACGREYDRINFFMHGHPKALNRNMISMLNIDTFCSLLKSIAAPGCVIVFFACKTAKLDNGFAAQVALKTGRDVIGHTTSGHTTRNPYKRRLVRYFDGIAVAIDQWKKYGGISALEKRLNEDDYAPFEFVEEVFE